MVLVAVSPAECVFGKLVGVFGGTATVVETLSDIVI